MAVNATYLPANADRARLRLDPARRDRAGGRRGRAATTGSPSIRPPWSWYTDYPPSEIDPESPIVAVAQEAGRDLGVDVLAEGIDTTYDGALLTLFAETPSPAFGPGDLGRAHAPDEWVGIDELVLGAKLYARAISPGAASSM